MRDFFDKYRVECEEFNRGPIHIPKIDPKNGIPGGNVILMFINERPGRVGPGRSDRISFENPDPTAYRFKRLFETLSIDRKNIFITNVCIYYPLRADYHDVPPSAAEFNFSMEILNDQIKRVNPRIIVPMGNSALRALKKLFPESSLRKFSLKNNIGTSINDAIPYIVFPLYHTSNRAAITRREKDQERDWGLLKKIIDSEK
jgi:uracil-DNA glycosylase family 4